MELWPLYDPIGPRSIAIHEAGHAVAVLHLKLKSVEVAQRMMPDKGIRRGYTEMVPEDWDQKNEDAARTHMTLALSGPMAERKYNWKFHEHNGADRDFNDVQSMAFTAVCKSDDLDNHGELTSDERSRILELIGSAETKAFHLVEDNYSSINTVADALQEKGTLSGDDVAAIVAYFPEKREEKASSITHGPAPACPRQQLSGD